jgi:hypothetical protein
MTPEQEIAVCDHIIQHDRERKGLTEGKILKWIEETMHCLRSYASLARFSDRHTETVVRTTVAPQEDPKLQVPRADLDRYMALIAKVVQLAYCELIYNINETSLSDWEDRRPQKVLASGSLSEKSYIMVWGAACEIRYCSALYLREGMTTAFF